MLISLLNRSIFFNLYIWNSHRGRRGQNSERCQIIVMYCLNWSCRNTYHWTVNHTDHQSVICLALYDVKTLCLREVFFLVAIRESDPFSVNIALTLPQIASNYGVTILSTPVKNRTNAPFVTSDFRKATHSKLTGMTSYEHALSIENWGLIMPWASAGEGKRGPLTPPGRPK